jgi:hypothetical protein
MVLGNSSLSNASSMTPSVGTPAPVFVPVTCR